MTEETYVLHVNGQAFRVPMNQLVGVQVRALAGIDPAYDLILEGEGNAPDRILGDEDTVSLTDSTARIFTRPPTAFGLHSE